MAREILTFDGITKRFPGVNALSDVSFSIRQGECHALLGENGAGKSTLGKIVGGIYRPDAGRLLLDGKPVSFRSPLDACDAGVRIVHQELAFCPNLSIAENLFLGCMPSRMGFFRRRYALRQAREMLARVGLTLDPATPMEQLSTGQEQLVQIAVAIDAGARIIVMDEPTSSLSQAEVERLFEIMDELRSAGITVIYVSHRLEEIRRLCDRISVLRDGRYVSTCDARETSQDEIVRLMIGRPLAEYFPRHLSAARGGVRLSVEGLSAPGVFENVSFQVHAGEIVGLAGLVGAGRSEIARAIFGVDRAGGGTLHIDGRAATIFSPREAIAQGIGLLPEDRKRQGLVLPMTCKENLSLSVLDRLQRAQLIRRGAERALAAKTFSQLAVRAPHIDAGVAGLSGGNQQKIAFAKWLARDCSILILDEPTRGVDVGAKAEIHALIDQLAAEGRAVLLISSELPELLSLSTRILVLRSGRIVGEVARADANQEMLLRMMAGVAENAAPTTSGPVRSTKRGADAPR